MQVHRTAGYRVELPVVLRPVHQQEPVRRFFRVNPNRSSFTKRSCNVPKSRSTRIAEFATPFRLGRVGVNHFHPQGLLELSEFAFSDAKVGPNP